ncbi:A-kinase anchor protein 14 [Poeciliopsis prolifica]|uniref:A-kinase anchor protein 14 n=1 Tax=Poeciliopsis prolifica TaxID=188132 RepID=UPI0024136998|nr:A-kinase anchor protein 14 [Poeciliopsis prolifica]
MEQNLPGTNEPAELSLLIKSLRFERQLKEELENPPPSMMDSTVWGLCKDFTVEGGRYKIAAYIKTWDIKPVWVYNVDYLGTEPEEDFKIHIYRGLFMAPTARKPIGDRVNIYFAMEVSKAEPEAPVEVRFILESRRLIHTPGRSKFSEKWLTDITETKDLFQRMMES